VSRWIFALSPVSGAIAPETGDKARAGLGLRAEYAQQAALLALKARGEP
jgi:hypothetical protein